MEGKSVFVKKKDLDQFRLKTPSEIAGEVSKREVELLTLPPGGANSRGGAKLRKDLAQLKTILNEIVAANKKGTGK